MKHLDSRRLKEFMLGRMSLTEVEHEHLSRCPQCQFAMAEETLAEFRTEAQRTPPGDPE